jgi:hypothetical protein
MPANDFEKGPSFCRGGEWTKVIWSSFHFTTYNVSFSVPGVELDWRRYSTLPPFHTWGTHNTNGPFGAVVAGSYCDFWFRPPVDLNAFVRVRNSNE